MSVLEIAVTDLGGPPGPAPLLVLGPSLGTRAVTLWTACAADLGSRHRVVGWDLPGHGDSPSATGWSLEDLSRGVLAAVDGAYPGTTFAYAGDSVGAAVGLHLLLGAPDRVTSAVLACTGARIGTPDGWRGRAAAVRSAGTGHLLATAPARWFGPGFAERESELAAALLADLDAADDEGYAAACEALAGHDVRGQLHRVDAPVLALAGGSDPVTTPADLRHLATGVRHGRLVVLDDVGHLAPAEAPGRVADLVTEHVRQDTAAPSARTTAQVRAEGMAVRRQVLGDAHVDRASAATSAFTTDFQDFITTYAWGEVWTRPGLDRRSRSLVTLTALVARGHHDELAMHVRAARTNGLTAAEIGEVLLQTAIYCGVPDANAAFRVAAAVLAEEDTP